MLLDTVACISCQLRLDDWKRLMTDLDTMTHKRVQYLFMAQPYSKKLLEGYDLGKPIVAISNGIDLKGRDGRLNQTGREIKWEFSA